jgi:hypothetical protein
MTMTSKKAMWFRVSRTPYDVRIEPIPVIRSTDKTVWYEHKWRDYPVMIRTERKEADRHEWFDNIDDARAEAKRHASDRIKYHTKKLQDFIDMREVAMEVSVI